MNAQTKILLASPREPSGGSWLINCLLELGVRVNFKPTVDRVWRSVKDARAPSAMWQPAPNGRWRLHPRADALRKWLPVLSRCETLVFRDDVEALYVQDLPRPEFYGERIALFVRDPRDAIHSYYRRIQPEMSLREFVRFPHPQTLLDAIAHWRLFVDCWLAREGIHVYRFEDYKVDAIGLLTQVVDDFDIGASSSEIARAASESSYEKARAAEALYRGAHPEDAEVAMRAGRVGEWQGSQELRNLAREIEERAGMVLARLGYTLDDGVVPRDEVEGISNLRFLSLAQHIELPSGLRETIAASDPMGCPTLPDVLRSASTIDADAIRRTRLQAREARILLDSILHYVEAWHGHLQRRVLASQTHFEEGEAYHMARIRELMMSHRTTRRPKPQLGQDDFSSSA